MALVKSVLQQQLAKAFEDSMKEFMNQLVNGSLIGAIDGARYSASQKFGNAASEAIDTYIKSASIIIPAGQAVVAGSPSGPGSTVSPSSPATIS